MFKLEDTEILSRNLHKSDFYGFSPHSIKGVNHTNNNIEIHIPPNVNYIPLQISFLLIRFEVTQKILNMLILMKFV